MPRYLRNRSTKEIVSFLLAHGFLNLNTVGDDDIYVKDGWLYPVKVTQSRPDRGYAIYQAMVGV